MLCIIPVVHQPSSGGSSGDEDSWCSECAGREGGAAGVVEGGGVPVLVVRGVATALVGVFDDDGWAALLSVAGAGQPSGMVEVAVTGVAVLPEEKLLTTGVAAVILGVDMSVAEGTKGLASMLREDSTAGAGWCVSVTNKGDAEAEVGGRSGVFLEGYKTEEVCDARAGACACVYRGAVAKEGVLVIGVVVWESGVEPGGVWRTESRKEKVWETGLKLSPVINARLLLTFPAKLLLLAALACKLRVGSGMTGTTFSSFSFCQFLADAGKSWTHMGS